MITSNTFQREWEVVRGNIKMYTPKKKQNKTKNMHSTLLNMEKIILVKNRQKKKHTRIIDKLCFTVKS